MSEKKKDNVLKQSKEWLNVKKSQKSVKEGNETKSNVVIDHIVSSEQQKLNDTALEVGKEAIELLDSIGAIYPKLSKRDVENRDQIDGAWIDKPLYSKTRSDLLIEIEEINDKLVATFDTAMTKGSIANWEAVKAPLKRAKAFVKSCEAHLNATK